MLSSANLMKLRKIYGGGGGGQFRWGLANQANQEFVVNADFKYMQE